MSAFFSYSLLLIMTLLTQYETVSSTCVKTTRYKDELFYLIAFKMQPLL
jgi:hypothetical protein